MIFTLWHAKQQFTQCGKTQNMSLSYQICTPLMVIAHSRKLRRGENAILPCPPCAVDYNKNMSAVDRHDQLV